MATIVPVQRKQDFSQSNQYYTHRDKGMQHPLSPHATSEEQRPSVPVVKSITSYNDDNIDQSDLMQLTHPLSPHATCPDQDPAHFQANAPVQAQRSSPDHYVKPAANVVVDQNPLSPHTTPFHQIKQRTHSVSTTDSSTSGQPNFTPSETSTTATSTGTNSQAVNNTTKTILLINGPNLNLLGHREPHIYGHTTLADITTNLTAFAKSQGIQLQHFQSNHESQILDRIHACLLGTLPTTQSSAEYNVSSSQATQQQQPQQTFTRPDAIIINPGAFTHTSVALRDALLGVSVPYVEVHISNVHAREEFRHKSYLSDKAVAVIAGLGVSGYEAAVRFWAEKWELTK